MVLSVESGLGSLGRAVARHAQLVIALWVLACTVSAAFYPGFVSRQLHRTAHVPGSESDLAAQEIRAQFPWFHPEVGGVVFTSSSLTVDDTRYRMAIGSVLIALQGRPEVQWSISPLLVSGQVSKDRRSAVAPVAFRGDQAVLHKNSAALQLMVQEAVRRIAGDRITAYLVSISLVSAEVIAHENAGVARAEILGALVALGVLLLVMGAVVAASLPLAVAVAAILLAFGVLGGLSHLTSFDSILGTIVPMLGLALGIDYALFIVARFRRELGQRRAVVEAVAAAMTAAGSTVALSGAIVVLCMAAMLLVRTQTIRHLAAGAVLVALCTLLAALTLLPALLTVLGDRVERGALFRKLGVTSGATRAGLPRWFGDLARMVMRSPIVIAVVVAGLLVACALPVLDVRLGMDIGVASATQTSVGQGQQVMEREFAPGTPMTIAAIYTAGGERLSDADLRVIRRLTEVIGSDPLVADVDSVTNLEVGGDRPSDVPARLVRFLPAGLRMVSEDSASTLIVITPAVRSDSAEAMVLVRRLRLQIAPRILVDAPGARIRFGATPPELLDFTEEVERSLWPVITVILVLSFVLLIVVFRSLLLPAKALLMNLLSTGAAFGLTVWIFQEGHLREALGFRPNGTIQVFLPLLVFTMLFAVSMDYEVFLVRRIQEVWRRSADNEQAVVEGMTETALPITGAAAIMVAVFGAFVLVDVLEIKQIGFALAVAVALDATLVRLLLVPAVMRIAGRWNWWVPWSSSRLRHGPVVDR